MDANFFKIKMDFEDFEIQRVSYSDEKLRELRSNHNEIASFF